ncbi:nucleoside triphosphate pyrophosphohydrolase [Acinetobacter rudis]|uniref:nucleoside triphosphate pyrophosphohydrolase n=1 Tax=Acinetobacter rudis TaxID=632955 RepID=UPI00280D8AD9|nr:nucleoside triphosphate pyrophosphohydrolase [Acinetobacter rudis]MDQ8952850.1 nucleoside triphosphate pyrophosphohydrolase [Acinetobacter rudis]
MEQLLKIMQQLREQCPWDQAQTPLSLTPYAIEEAYEVEQAIRSGDVQAIREELGDLLLQVVFQSQMYAEQGAFDFSDVVQTLSDKLVRRHPHVFQAEKFQSLSADEVSELWQKIKIEEKRGKVSLSLDQVKPGPAILQAHEIQKIAAKSGFDFEDAQQAYGKLEEELAELQQAMAEGDSDEIQGELGDCLFSLVNVGRKLNQSSESALLATVAKFRQRYAYIETQAQQQNKNIEQLSLEEMEQFWQQAKQLELHT